MNAAPIGGARCSARSSAASPGIAVSAARLTPMRAQPTNAGLYSLVVSNPLGMLTSRRAKLAVSAGLPPTNQPPVLTVNAGQTVIFTNSANSGNPGRRFTFSLASAPVGGTINTDSGVFTWRPPVRAAGTTNLVEVLVTDDGTPPATSIQTFAVVVDSLQPVLLTPVSISDGRFQLRVSGTLGPDYIVETAADLTDWRGLQTSSPASMPFDFADTNANFSTNRFYRVRLTP